MDARVSFSVWNHFRDRINTRVCEHCPFGHVCEKCPLGPCLVCGCSKARDKFGDRICFCDSCRRRGCENIPDEDFEQLVGWHAGELTKVRAMLDTKATMIILGKCEDWMRALHDRKRDDNLGRCMTKNQARTVHHYIVEYKKI
jgi:hypothetical protein